MKVVIFCGGMGLRMRELSRDLPKPMMSVGDRPILWHIMKYYAHYGHRDFILCLGYQGQAIKQYFLKSQEDTSANDFVIQKGGVQSLPNEMQDWSITFVDTGLHTNIGQRLHKVRHLLKDEPAFMATYGDNVCDAPLNEMADAFAQHPNHAAMFLCVHPSQSFHLVQMTGTNGSTQVRGFVTSAQSNLWINGGYFICRKAVFDEMAQGEDMIPEAFNRLAAQGRLSAWRHEGFWAAMDTPKEMSQLDSLYSTGLAPWAKWDLQMPQPAELARP